MRIVITDGINPQAIAVPVERGTGAPHCMEFHKMCEKCGFDNEALDNHVIPEVQLFSH